MAPSALSVQPQVAQASTGRGTAAARPSTSMPYTWRDEICDMSSPESESTPTRATGARVARRREPKAGLSGERRWGACELATWSAGFDVALGREGKERVRRARRRGGRVV